MKKLLHRFSKWLYRKTLNLPPEPAPVLDGEVAEKVTGVSPLNVLEPSDGTSKYAAQLGWFEILTKQRCMRSFLNASGHRINVYRKGNRSTFTVGTAINHPTKGKTQLFRKNVNPEQLQKIFENPRVHTGKGYYKF